MKLPVVSVLPTNINWKHVRKEGSDYLLIISK